MRSFLITKCSSELANGWFHWILVFILHDGECTLYHSTFAHTLIECSNLFLHLHIEWSLNLRQKDTKHGAITASVLKSLSSELDSPMTLKVTPSKHCLPHLHKFTTIYGTFKGQGSVPATGL